jgi:hypothetical protein
MEELVYLPFLKLLTRTRIKKKKKKNSYLLAAALRAVSLHEILMQ